MADIELVIKIPEKDWEFIKESDGCRWSRAILDGVINGMPLKKGHGAIIDVKDIDRIHISDNGEVVIYKLGTDVKAFVHACALVEADEGDKCDNDNDCEHCDWVECSEMKGEAK